MAKKEIFDHLQMSDRWVKYFKNYAQGVTVIEQLIHWLSQVNQMIENVNDWNSYLEEFVETFDEKLKPTVYEFLQEMYDNGDLKVIIDEFLNLKSAVIDEKLEEFNEQLEQIAQLAPPPNGTDDTQNLKDFFSTHPKNVKMVGVYRIRLTEGDHIAKYIDMEGITIDGKLATIIDLKDDYVDNGAITSLFYFDNCTNVTIDVNFEGQPVRLPHQFLGYKGMTVVYFTNHSSGLELRGDLKNCRYGLLSGNYEIIELGNCSNIKVDIVSDYCGYPIACYLVDNIEGKIIAENTHRAGYLGGVRNANIDFFVKNQYIADTLVLLTDAKTGEGTSRGCSDIDLYVEDLGSTLYQPTSVLAGISLSRVDKNTKFHNIKVKLKLVTSNSIATTMHGWRVSSGAKGINPSYPYNWDPSIEISGLVISGLIDRTKQTISAGSERAVAIRGEDGNVFGTFKNISFDNFTVLEKEGDSLPLLISARGLREGLIFNNVTLKNVRLDVFTNVNPVNIINSVIQQYDGNTPNLVGSTILTTSNSNLQPSNINNSFIGGFGVETKVQYFEMDLSQTTSKNNVVPSGALLLSVLGVVTEEIQGVATISVGDNETPNLYAWGVSGAKNSKITPSGLTDKDALPKFQSSNNAIKVSSDGVISGGKIKFFVAYMVFTPPNI